MSEKEYQLGPIPNYKSIEDRPRFYVAYKTPNTYVAICPRDSFSFSDNLKEAQRRAGAIAADVKCVWPTHAIVEVLDKDDGMGAFDHSWRIHPAFPDRETVETPLDYPDAGSW